MTDTDYFRRAAALAAVTLAVTLVFVAWPALDLTVTGWFYDPATGFPVENNAILTFIRMTVWDAAIALFVVATAALLAAWRGWRLLGLGPRHWAFVALLFALGPGIAANAILKQLWGRARPATVEAFGGGKLFTPVWQPADQCVHNCSFVSGEGAAAVALGVVMIFLMPHLGSVLRGPVSRGAYVAAAVVLPLVTLFQRLATGRHFLSDLIFAGLIVFAIALALHAWLRPTRPRG